LHCLNFFTDVEQKLKSSKPKTSHKASLTYCQSDLSVRGNSSILRVHA